MSDLHLALLRGVNVGGKNKLPMRELVDLFEGAGATRVRTYIQSGNVCFAGDATRVRETVRAGIRERFGFDAPIVLRTGSELDAVVRGNPYLADGADEGQLHVLFLEDAPDEHAVQQLDPARSLPDTFAVRGREIYLRLPNGMAKTRLTNAWFDARLRTVTTARNWRTVRTLRDWSIG